MTKYCPIMSFQKDYAEENVCMEDCAFADEAGECLIRQALQCYVSAARTQIVNKAEVMATSSSGYPYTMEPTSDCVIRSYGPTGSQEGV